MLEEPLIIDQAPARCAGGSLAHRIFANPVCQQETATSRTSRLQTMTLAPGQSHAISARKCMLSGILSTTRAAVDGAKVSSRSRYRRAATLDAAGPRALSALNGIHSGLADEVGQALEDVTHVGGKPPAPWQPRGGTRGSARSGSFPIAASRRRRLDGDRSRPSGGPVRETRG